MFSYISFRLNVVRVYVYIAHMLNQARKVFVGLSGGVDSSVSAALLNEADYEVTGVFIKVWSPASKQGLTLGMEKGRTLFGLCQAADDRLDAMRVCAKLGIPFVELNLEKEYKREVVDYMIREYRAGRTPNPDVFCNRFIKFGAFYKWAMEHGADFIATGHYARIVKSQKLKVKSLGLFAGSDPRKDQSYFLWQIRKEQLRHILFPVGGMKKSDVRRLAKKFGLPTAEKKDSQGLCFVGKVDMKEFLSQYIKPRRGRVLGEGGEILGEHKGAFFYTLGERVAVFPRLSRSNLESEKRFYLGEAKPFYVISKDIRKNTLTVSHKDSSGALLHGRKEVSIKDCNWLMEPELGKTYLARVRYRQPLQSCKLKGESSKVVFDKAQTAAAGQSLALYLPRGKSRGDGETLAGGGVIA